MQNNMCNFRTDMADERVDEYKKVHNLSNISGIKVDTKTNQFLKITTVDILNDNGKQAVGKEIGKYITIETENVTILTDEEKIILENEITEQLKILIGKKYTSAMIVGLGNEYVTPDALGPKVISYINVTRHVIKYAKNLIEPGTMEISAISPGVLGMTGIETEEIIESIVDRVKPEIILVIDSLASMSVSRVGKTIQLGNTGITPGAGIGNRRKSLNEKNLGIPVIAIGVPTVVSMATILDEYSLKVNTAEKEMIVTPKEIDKLIENLSKVIAEGINNAT